MRSRKKTDIIQDLDPDEAKHLLEQGAEALGISLSPYQVEQFMAYLTLLDKWNRHINLTGLQVLSRDYCQAFFGFPYPHTLFIRKNADYWTWDPGPDFPGLPIKIVRPTQPVTLIEASAKKVSFLKEAVRHLKLRPHSYLSDLSG